MNKIITDEEKINIALYRDYEITEWREKCLILTKGEQKICTKSPKWWRRWINENG